MNQRTILRSVLIAVLSLVATAATAHSFEVNGIYYNKNGDGTVSVTFKGSRYYEYADEYTGNVMIPSSVTYSGTTYSVTSIGEYAFQDCSGLTSVTIPNSVTSIDDRAFCGCGLTSINIPNSVSSIGDRVFSFCRGLKSIVVESGNSKYDSRDNCNAIIETATNTLLAGCKNTTIPNSVTSIGDGAFNGCSGLTSASIPNSVTYIGEYAFWDCSSLKKAIVKAITPPSIWRESFNNYDLKLIVPAISKEEYKSANIWSSFTNYADAEIMITALGLEKNNASIKSGETIQLTATATPADATFADVFLWTSGNEDVATVDGNGVVTAIADGTATITASTVDGSNITAACVVSVGAGAVEGVDTAAARIYTADGNIIIAAAEDGEAAVYDFTGHLIKSVPVASGNSTAVPITPGYYIVKTGTKTQSVVVK